MLLLLTDVKGVYNLPPSNPKAELLSLYRQEESSVEIGAKSSQGRGGMASKIEAASFAVAPGAPCGACVIGDG